MLNILSNIHVNSLTSMNEVQLIFQKGHGIIILEFSEK